MDEARMVAQQITVRLTNGWRDGNEATKRDIEMLCHCERSRTNSASPWPPPSTNG